MRKVIVWKHPWSTLWMVAYRTTFYKCDGHWVFRHQVSPKRDTMCWHGHWWMKPTKLCRTRRRMFVYYPKLIKKILRWDRQCFFRANIPIHINSKRIFYSVYLLVLWLKPRRSTRILHTSAYIHCIASLTQFEGWTIIYIWYSPTVIANEAL